MLLASFEGTSPVGSFPPNGYGLFDMAATSGNGPAIGLFSATRTESSSHVAAQQSTHASIRLKRVMTYVNRNSAFHARSSKVARTYVPPTTACVTAPGRQLQMIDTGDEPYRIPLHYSQILIAQG
jgi:hypothetical protein